MSEIAEAQVAVDAQPEVELEANEMHAEPENSATDPRALTVSVDDFAALEERVVRAVNLVKQERQARTAAEQRLARAEADLREQTERMERTDAELATLRAERDDVRQRVEKLLQQLDALEL
jgi:chromosome segregation ATPase